MIFLIYLCLLAITILWTKNKYNTLLLPQVLYTCMAAGGGILAKLNPLNLIEASDATHYYMIISIIVFNLTSFAIIKRSKKIDNNTESIAFNFSDQGYNAIIFLTVIGIALMLPNTIQVLQRVNIFSLNFEQSRQFYAELTQSGRFLYVFFTCNIPTAILNVGLLLCAIELTFGKKKLLGITAIFLLLVSFTYGGRSYFLNFAVYFFVAQILIGQKRVKKTKIRLRYIIFAVFCIILITLARDNGKNSLFGWFTLYFSGSFSFFEYMRIHPNLFGLNEPLLFGYLTFGFLLEPFILATKAFFGVPLDVPSYYFNKYAQIFVDIGETNSIWFNNNTTWLYTFIRDWGPAGVIIGPVLVALVMGICINRYNQNPTTRNLCLICIGYTCVINATMSYTMTSVSSSLILLFVILATSKWRIRLR